MRAEKLNCRPWQAIGKNTAFSALFAALLLAMGSAQATMYRWVDSNGRVQYGDTLPPTYQKSGAAEMNKQGQVIKRTQSEAERKAEAERQAQEKRAQQDQQKQAQKDRALTSTYTSEAEIDLARDRALEHHKLAIQGAEIRSKAVDANLADLNGRATSLKKAGRPVNPNLMSQLEQANNESLELKRTIQSNEDAMDAVREKYAADKARFRELMGKN
jgi:hypothetical protein